MPRRKQPLSNTPRKLKRRFYSRPAEQLAPDLLGKILVRRLPGREYRVRIVETEAYVGPHDLACHASKGRTKRTEIMFGPAGFAYVYLIYGMYAMLNIVSGTTGHPEAVLIRAAEPLDDAAFELHEQGMEYDTVRGAFLEGKPAYPGAGFSREGHIQVAVRNPACILGVFRPHL